MWSKYIVHWIVDRTSGAEGWPHARPFSGRSWGSMVCHSRRLGRKISGHPFRMFWFLVLFQRSYTIYIDYIYIDYIYRHYIIKDRHISSPDSSGFFGRPGLKISWRAPWSPSASSATGRRTTSIPASALSAWRTPGGHAGRTAGYGRMVVPGRQKKAMKSGDMMGI